MAKKKSARKPSSRMRAPQQRAARSEGPSKSKAIRDYFDSHPTATAKEVVAALGEQGISVSEAYVYSSKPKRRWTKRSAAKARRGAGRSGRRDLVSIDQLVAARKFVDQVGGVDQAKNLVSTLAKLG